MSLPPDIQLPIITSDGTFIAHYSTKGLSALDWPHEHKTIPKFAPPSPQIRKWHRLTESALKKSLAGKPPNELPPLDWSHKTPFQKSVWLVMLSIPCGKTLSYGQVAQKINNPKAVRAVGSACGANPIPVLVPCHRILAANKKIGGFSGGMEWKNRLLTREGITPTP